MIQGSRRIPGPVYDLPEVQRMVRDGPNFGLAVEQGLKAIALQRRCTQPEARAFAREAVLTLVEDDYSSSVEWPSGERADEYGNVIEGQGWYIKVSIELDSNRAYVHSCHLAMHPIETKSGTVPRAHRW